MAAAEALRITRGVDKKVEVVNQKVDDIDERVQIVDMKVEGIDNQVRGIDSKIQGVDDKVGSVIQGEFCPLLAAPRTCPRPFTPLGVKETGIAIRQVVDQVGDLNRS